MGVRGQIPSACLRHGPRDRARHVLVPGPLFLVWSSVSRGAVRRRPHRAPRRPRAHRPHPRCCRSGPSRSSAGRRDALDGNDGLQFVEHAVWMRSLNVEYFVGVDGLSIADGPPHARSSRSSRCGAAWSITKQRDAATSRCSCSSTTGMMGVFVALDFFLFYVFWEVMLLPMYFLIGIWGGPRKEYAAIKFFLYTLAGSVLMLLAFIALYCNSSARLPRRRHARRAHLHDPGARARVDFADQRLTLLGVEFVKVCWVRLFVGFAIKIPMFPLPHLAARRARRGADGDRGHPRRRAPQDGHLRHPAHQLRASCPRRRSGRRRHGGVRRDQHRLRRVLRHRAERPEEAGRLLVGQPHGLLPASGMGALHADAVNGAHDADVQPRHHHVDALHPGRRALRPRAHARASTFGGIGDARCRCSRPSSASPSWPRSACPALSGFWGEALVFLGAFPATARSRRWRRRASCSRPRTTWALAEAVPRRAPRVVAHERAPRSLRRPVPRPERARGRVTLAPLAVLVVVLGVWPVPIFATIAGGVRRRDVDREPAGPRPDRAPVARAPRRAGARPVTSPDLTRELRVRGPRDRARVRRAPRARVGSLRAAARAHAGRRDDRARVARRVVRRERRRAHVAPALRDPGADSSRTGSRATGSRARSAPSSRWSARSSCSRSSLARDARPRLVERGRRARPRGVPRHEPHGDGALAAPRLPGDRARERRRRTSSPARASAIAARARRRSSTRSSARSPTGVMLYGMSWIYGLTRETQLPRDRRARQPCSRARRGTCRTRLPSASRA